MVKKLFYFFITMLHLVLCVACNFSLNANKTELLKVIYVCPFQHLFTPTASNVPSLIKDALELSNNLQNFPEMRVTQFIEILNSVK